MTAFVLWQRSLTPAGRGLLAGIILAIVGALLAWWWLSAHDARVIERHENQTRAEVSAKASEGASAGHRAASQTTDRIEQENDDARAAADGSDDPLADGLRRLRREGQD